MSENVILQEDGDNILLESGGTDNLLLEATFLPVIDKRVIQVSAFLNPTTTEPKIEGELE